DIDGGADGRVYLDNIVVASPESLYTSKIKGSLEINLPVRRKADNKLFEPIRLTLDAAKLSNPAGYELSVPDGLFTLPDVTSRLADIVIQGIDELQGFFNDVSRKLQVSVLNTDLPLIGDSLKSIDIAARISTKLQSIKAAL